MLLPGRTKAGAKLLDHHFGGPHWVDQIDLESLSLVSHEDCVLGQLFGEYSTGKDVLDIHFWVGTTPAAKLFGFLDTSTRSWRRLIRRRRRQLARRNDTFAEAA